MIRNERNIIKEEVENKEQRGITLVALVITIIILLILAGVGIYLIVNNDLLGKAQSATEENRKKTAIEIMNLKISNIQILNYSEKAIKFDLQYIADKLCEDDDIEYVIKKIMKQLV